ncbi:SH3 domain-containing protein [Micromonospora sp. NPDC049051]|uniref:SH3 domain-containing protein n=1 Tax=Micromonospora sp. NPDC049051 TaxID=3364264 RepID=UPI003717EE1D
MRRSKSVVALAQAALTLAAAAGIVAVAGAPASAGCSHTWSDKDYGSSYVEGAGSTGLALRTGPHTSCALVTRIPNGHWVAFDCWTTGDYYNSYDNFWQHVRYGNGGPTYSGWIASSYLHDPYDGNLAEC